MTARTVKHVIILILLLKKKKKKKEFKSSKQSLSSSYCLNMEKKKKRYSRFVIYPECFLHNLPRSFSAASPPQVSLAPMALCCSVVASPPKPPLVLWHNRSLPPPVRETQTPQRLVGPCLALLPAPPSHCEFLLYPSAWKEILTGPPSLVKGAGSLLWSVPSAQGWGRRKAMWNELDGWPGGVESIFFLFPLKKKMKYEERLFTDYICICDLHIHTFI